MNAIITKTEVTEAKPRPRGDGSICVTIMLLLSTKLVVEQHRAYIQEPRTRAPTDDEQMNTWI